VGGPYHALFVDYGGVLTTSLSTSFAAFCVSSGVSPERLRSVLAGAYTALDEANVRVDDMHDLVKAVETGRLDPAEFDRRLAAALSEGLRGPIEPEGLTDRLFAGVGPDEDMRAAVGAARRLGLRTAVISNTWGRGTFHPAEDLVDVVVLSEVVGIRKPDPDIYLIAAERVGVPPQSCVFVDDVPLNVEGARAVGMAAVLHRDARITIPKLESLFGSTLRPEGP
jgi:epoxide hydrolase-like predicted phosphatase